MNPSVLASEAIGDFATYPRRILVAVTGLTPQVVTETLFALAVEQRSFLPTEIHVLTTGEGARRIEMLLLDGGKGHFHRLRAEYGLPPIDFGESRIHVLRDPEGGELPDIQTPEQQNWAADTITAVLRELTQDDGAALHVSLAGGRKSMGFFLGYALSLFGRRQDRLSHVLVSEPFESHPGFFYPPVKPQVLLTRDQRPVRTSDARIMLADIPFVRLRNGLPKSLLAGDARFSEVVEAARVISAESMVTLDIEAKRLHCGGVAVPMKPAELALYLWLARRARWPSPGAAPVNARNASAESYLDEYKLLVGEWGDFERVQKTLSDNASFGDFLRERVSRANKVIELALGRELCQPYRITYCGQRGRGGYALKLAAHQIEVVPAASSRDLPTRRP